MKKHFLFSALLIAALTPACGSTASGPVITAASASAVDNGDGTFTLTIDASVEDDVLLDSYTLDCTDGDDPSNDIDVSDTFADALTAGDISFELDNVPATPFNYTCTLEIVDEDGFSSGLFDFDFDLS